MWNVYICTFSWNKTKQKSPCFCYTQGASLVSQRRVQTREMRSLLFPPDLPYCPDLNVNVKNVKEVEKEVKSEKVKCAHFCFQHTQLPYCTTSDYNVNVKQVK